MRDLSREWIAVGLNGNAEKIVPVIRMDGTGEVKKVIRGVSGVNRISIYHQDFSARTVKKSAQFYGRRICGRQTCC